ncbi:S8 family serine peptidase [Lentzea sp. BCCO 10_0061]|uniref:S8 family serine peptidase n=1 Tax=Lentzea sokolovensis TaxID=3095429 RepID=A0ABU4VDN4_9PSEU|nr:S8 family serine peptidase [Lentzea sp. BCCO 10_0061]MDX8149550.1 S8 family serine peptidase [Lentzea sp. BCCO 10_0061]
MTEPAEVETTGRFLVLLQEDAVEEGLAELGAIAGFNPNTGEIGSDTLQVFPELGVAVVSGDPNLLGQLNGAAEGPGAVQIVEPERVVHVFAAPAEEEAPEAAADESVLTWGLQAVGADVSTATGKGIKIAVLDTGWETNHPDFAGRTITTKSFITGEDVQDGHGHGTHCIGTSSGPRKPATLPGYGVASEAEIFAGKVLSNAGSGSDGGILAGIDWAVANGCAVISMSLGADVPAGTPYSQIYETVAQRAMAKGTLIIAAAGNASSRPARIAPVGHPARCPSIIAVAAIDVNRAIASFSSGSADRIGQIDVCAPGVDVYSSFKLPQKYSRLRGTSMATPHVAGVAVLIAERTGARGFELWARLAGTALRLPLPSTDIGTGLVQAP